MTRLYHSIALVACMAILSYAGFVGFPLESNTNAPTWYEARDLYNPIGQLYSGVVERCYASGVPLPSIVETWTVSAGISNSVVGAYTNIILLSDTVTTTNQLGPFEYEYTDDSGTHTATGYPYVTRAFLNALDSKIDQLFPHFVDHTTADTNGLYDDYFLEMREYNDDYGKKMVWEDFLDATKAGIFLRTGIGYVVSNTIATNAGGYVTNGTAYYTRQPETRRDWLLSELHASTSTWVHVDVGTLDTRLYDDSVLPVARYIPGGTGGLGSVSITITGLVLNVSNQTTYASNEVVTISATNTECGLPWYDIQNITSESAYINTGDVVSVLYTNELVLYGDRPYRLYARDLDERWTVLTNLLTVEHTSWGWTLTTNEWYGDGAGSDAASARASADTNWHMFGTADAPWKFTSTICEDTNSYTAGLISSWNRALISNIPTNNGVAASFAVYAQVLSPNYDRDPVPPEPSDVFYDASYGFKTNQMQRIESGSLTASETNKLSNYYGDIVKPAWEAQEPNTNTTVVGRGWKFFSGIGYPDIRVLITPEFVYK